jgi:hypothetical protein
MADGDDLYSGYDDYEDAYDIQVLRLVSCRCRPMPSRTHTHACDGVCVMV